MSDERRYVLAETERCSWCDHWPVRGCPNCGYRGWVPVAERVVTAVQYASWMIQAGVEPEAATVLSVVDGGAS